MILAHALLLFPLASATEAPQPDIVDTAVSAGSFSTLVAALEAAELVDALRSDGPFTVLAPTDEAFAKIPKDTLSALLLPQNKGALIDVLKLHVISGQFDASSALAAGHAKTLAGESIDFALRDGRLFVEDSGVVANDISTSNGIVHAIDTVLLPEGGLDLAPQGRLVVGVYFEAPSKALASQLGIEDRHRALMLTSIVKGGEAEKAGLQKYDVIVGIDGEPATDKTFKAAKQRAGYGGTVALTIIRRAEHHVIEVGVGAEH